MRSPGRFVATVALAAVLSACGGNDGIPDLPAGVIPTADPPAAASGAARPLPPCPSPPAGAQPPPEGLVVPDGTVVTDVTRNGPLLTVRGFVPLVPVDVRRFYERRDDLDILSLEDEGFEAEALFGSEDGRAYVKVKIICADGSTLLAVLGSAGAGDSVPTPAGSPAPGDG